MLSLRSLLWKKHRISSGPIILRLGFLCLALHAGDMFAQPIAPAGFVVEEAFPGVAFTNPVQVVFFPPSDARKLVVQKNGVVWVMTATGTRLSTPFIDLSQKVLSNFDRGLPSIALDPDFITNGWVYFLYEVDPDSNGTDNNQFGYSRVERYRVSTSNPNIIDLTTRQILIGGSMSTAIPLVSFAGGHSTGNLRFGRDKTLLVSCGDGADWDGVDRGGQDAAAFGPGLTDPSEDIGAFRSISLNSLNGKILRIDKETGNGLPSNPFWDGNATSDRSRVWLYGVRNSYRFTTRPGTGVTDPALGQPGTIFFGDVGWNDFEEINIARQGGMNFGWPCKEGPNSFEQEYDTVTSTVFPNSNVICSAVPNVENPAIPIQGALYWHHSNGALSNPVGWTGACAIGGPFYTGTSYPARYRNAYLFGDYERDWIRAMQVDANDNLIPGSDTLLVQNANGPVSIETDPQTGDVYFVSILSSRVYRVRYTIANNPPTINATLSPSEGLPPLTVTAHASGSTDPDSDPLSYLWTFGTGDSTHTPDTTYTYTTIGTYTAVLTVSDGRGGSRIQTFPVQVGQPPVAEIIDPVDSSFFNHNQLIALDAATADTNQGPVTYRWDIDLGHEEHIHPSQEVLFGQSSSFTALVANDGQKYYWMIRLTITQGPLTSRDTITIHPRVNITPVSMTFSPPDPHSASTFNAIIKIKSTGEIGSSNSFYEIWDGTTRLTTALLPSIHNGDSLTITPQLGPLASGLHTLTFRADVTDTLVETDETDNVISAAITITPAPDPLAIPSPAVLRDNFNAANAPLAGRLKWVNIQNMPSAGSMAINTNSIQPTSSGGTGMFGGIVWDTLMGGGTEMSVVLRQKSGVSGMPLFYLYARMSNKDFNTGSGYRLSVVENSGTDRIEIHRIGPGYTNDFILAGINREVNVNDTIVFRILSNNQTMAMLINGASVLQATDATNNASQWYFAIRARVNSTPLRLDDFKVSSQPVISGPPSLLLNAPNGGESWTVGSVRNIQWTSSLVSLVDLFYQTSSGPAWLSIASGVAAAGGNYAWTVPASPTTQARVKIVDTANPALADSSNAVFTIASPPPPSVPVLASPVNGSTNVPTSTSLSWNASSGATQYRLQLSTDSLFTILILDDSLIASTSRAISGLTQSTRYFWRVNARNASGASLFSAPWSFTTSAPSGTITSPAVLRDDFNTANIPLAGRLKWMNIVNMPSGGSMAIVSNAIQPTVNSGGLYGGIVWDTLMSGGTEMSVTVLQKSNGNGVPTLFLYARMNNKDFNTATGYRLMLTENTGTDNIQLHRIGPGYPNDVATIGNLTREVNIGDTVTMRVMNDNQTLAVLINGINVLQATDATNNPAQWYFAIRARVSTTALRLDNFRVSSQSPTPGITVLAPNGGESWTIGSVQNITWSSALVSSVNLLYRTSSAGPWQPVASNLSAASGSYTWTIPNTPTTDARVRIEDASNASLADSSNASFAIAAVPPPQFSPAVLRDNFNRVDGTLAGTDKWQNLQNIPFAGSMGIVGNAIQPTVATNGIYGGIVWDSLVGGGTEISFTLFQKPGLTGVPVLFLYARMNNKDFNTGTGYRMAFVPNSGTDQIMINRIGPGYANDVTTVSVLREVNAGSIVTLRVLNDNRTTIVLVDGVEVLRSTDATYIPAHWYYAVRARVSSPALRLDDFRITPPVAAGASPQQDVKPVRPLDLSSSMLDQNYPNPFNPVTSFRFQVSSFGLVSLKVYDVLGREVATLVDEMMEPGTYQMLWDASQYPSGVYFFRMQARPMGNEQLMPYQAMRKMLLMK